MRECPADAHSAACPPQRTNSGAYWSSTRAALQPLFHSTGLASYHGITSAAVGELEADLSAAAAEGVAVDMAAAMCNLALKVRGHQSGERCSWA
jgi:cytochrome P450